MSTATRHAMRWILLPFVLAGAAYGTLVMFITVVLFFPMPATLSEPLCGFVGACTLVLISAIIAPLVKTFVAFLIAGLLAGVPFMDLHLPATPILLGGFGTASLVAFWFYPARTPVVTQYVSIAVAIIVLGLITAAFARFVDYPARPVPLSQNLTAAFGTNPPPVLTAFFEYDRGGFLDHEYLWRIDAPPDSVQVIIASLRLQPTNAVPTQFWAMPPHYWPGKMPAQGKAFGSEYFEAQTRGRDGEHYFLVHDPAKNRAYVWYKSNF